MRSSCRLPAVLLLAAAAACLAQSNLDAVAESARKEFEVPGIAVAVVKDGKVVVAKGYGVRKTGEPAPVTDRTLFGIASNTKAFTAAALAMLVDEGKLRWDDAVTKRMPWFQMYDPYVTREMTVRDLLCHRSGLGLGAGDLLFWPPTGFKNDEIIRRLRFVKPATSFRSRYAYDNVLYLVAGELIPAVTGKSWASFIEERIFAPVGMTFSNTSVRHFRPGDDVATPHSYTDRKLVPIEPDNLDNNAPAGAINSCIADMAKWIIVQLNRGDMGNGKRLFSARQSSEMWSPHTIIPTGEPQPDAPEALAAIRPNFSMYGLGWVLNDLRGHKIVTHTGGLAGYVSRVTLVPDLKLGMVVLTNQESGGAFQAITHTVLDYYMGAAPTDWVPVFAGLARRQQERGDEAVRRAAAERNADSRPSLPLASYAGRYRDAWYGDVAIEEQGGKLIIRFTHTPTLTGELEHWQYDTFVARWRDRTLLADAYVTFALKPDGSIDQVKMTAFSPLTDFSYDFHDLLLTPVAPDAPPY